MVRQWKRPGEDDAPKKGRLPDLSRFGGLGGRRKDKARKEEPVQGQPVQDDDIEAGSFDEPLPIDAPRETVETSEQLDAAAPNIEPSQEVETERPGSAAAEPPVEPVVMPAAPPVDKTPVLVPQDGDASVDSDPKSEADPSTKGSKTAPWSADGRRRRDSGKRRLLPSERRAAEAAKVAARTEDSALAGAPAAQDPIATTGLQPPSTSSASSAGTTGSSRSRMAGKAPWRSREEKPKRQVVVERKPRKRARSVNRWSPEVRLFVFTATLVVAGLAFASISGMFYLGSRVRADAGCGSCHAMRPYVAAHRSSGHDQVACSACHSRPGFLATFAEGARMGGWYADSLLGKKPSRVKVSDDGCRRCHRSLLTQTVDGRTVRVRHADFADEDCVSRCHSGTAHQAAGRWYMGPQMGDCLQCHRTSAAQMETCDECHPSRLKQAKIEGVSAWRSTHGADWKSTHGAGNLEECRVCHAPTDCARCHKIPLPHPEIWPRAHGHGLTAKLRKSCTTCHESSWCRNCHGIDMPHGKGFLRRHGAEAGRKGTEACYKCHSQRGCAGCHFESSHPNVPGVGMHDTLQGVLGSD